MAFFCLSEVYLKGGKGDKEAPDEAFIGRFTQCSPSVMQSCGAVSKHPVLLEPNGG